ncbi:MAG: excinuclease ABC subunit A [Bdellovibrionaceae bacterium]|nr:excinuclease ABC subunit A [Pseudobdellovibrionaceae bacterium]
MARYYKPTHEPQDENIKVEKARVHNLKEVSVTLPRDELIVITGPSGSGKSSLAFDTIYAEGQRRYVESLSVYARQFLNQMEKPDVESISGLSPTISIEQKTTSYNPRSTVGTVTELYDFLRLLYARASTPLCYQCGSPIESQSPQVMVDRILDLEEGTRISILSPIIRGRKGTYQKEFHELRQKGFVRVRVDGTIYELSDPIKLDRNKKHDIEVVVDRILVKGDRKVLSTRVSESVELALKMSEGSLLVEVGKPPETKSLFFSQHYSCKTCDISYPEPEPRIFSFNSPRGACPECEGIGYNEIEVEIEETDLEDSEIPYEWVPCKICEGKRLRVESLHFFIQEHSISDLTEKQISDLLPWFQNLTLNKKQLAIAEKVIEEIIERLEFLNQVGVGYLSLSRSAQTLSGGESQRIRLATQIGSSLVGVIYVLDEPSIGLHPRDHHRLLKSLTRLKDLGNTVLVVEHDQDTIEMADYIVDIGPGAGNEGGKLIAAGTLSEIKKDKNSITGAYLSGRKSIPTPTTRRPWNKESVISIKEAELNNLKKVSVDFPLGVLTCVTGVSGSGKSTLVLDTLYRALLYKVYKVDTGDTQTKSIKGLEFVDKVIDIDQSPIGRTPRSNPATYTGLFSLIRDLYAKLPESQVRGYKPGRFSFNVKGGRCEACEGDGLKKIEMHFMPNVYVPCEVCGTARYNRETLQILYKGKNIADVLDMTAKQALEFFDAVPLLKRKLQIINDVGLGYIKLGQSATTLSGGEAQRMKLSKELSKKATGKTVYILDEPTTGLHFEDVQKLISILHRLVDQGNTVIVIEHQLDVIKSADHVIDVGPEGGHEGGKILFTGTPEDLISCKKSHTGKFLKSVL